MIKVITDDFRQYFSLRDEECKHYMIPTDANYLSTQRDLLSAKSSVFYDSGFLPADKFNREANWAIIEATETETGIILHRPL